jgi:hypothetical protein
MKRFRPVKLEPGVDYRAEDLPAGSCVSREWEGKVHTVFVTKPPTTIRENRLWWRYIYMGKLYKTLSAVARQITGDTTLSGNRFFKLRRRRR